MPQGGPSYAGTGSAGALLDGDIYALKVTIRKSSGSVCRGRCQCGRDWKTYSTSPGRRRLCATWTDSSRSTAYRTNQFWRYVRTPEEVRRRRLVPRQRCLPTEFRAQSWQAESDEARGTIHYAVPPATNVSLKRTTISGALAKTVSNGPSAAGTIHGEPVSKGSGSWRLHSETAERRLHNLTRKVDYSIDLDGR